MDLSSNLGIRFAKYSHVFSRNFFVQCFKSVEVNESIKIWDDSLQNFILVDAKGYE